MDQLVIRGGLVIDGTGAAGQRADVGITDGRVTRIEPHLDGDRVIDADGLVVAPGFIDLHSHADFTLEGWPGADTQLVQGVTTMLTGNCGFSPFPVDADGQLERASEFLSPEISWSWTDTAGFSDTVRRVGPGTNVITQIGHCSIRIAAMGQDERSPTAAELATMQEMITSATAGGAYGFSTGLVYAPGTYADEAEVLALLRTASAAGLIHSTHLRNEGSGLLHAVGEAIRGAELTGIGLEISHLKAMGPANYGTVGDALAMIDEAVARGVDVQADVYPYTASSTSLMSRLPSWALDGGPEAMQHRLADSDTRARIAAVVEDETGKAFTAEGVVLASVSPGRYASYAGRNLAGLAAEFGSTSTEVMLDVLLEHGAGVSMINHAISAEDVAQVLSHRLVAVASDGWIMKPAGAGMPHPRSFGTFVRVLQHYVRETGLLTLEQAVHKMSGLPARRLGLADRGVLRPGAVADIAVLDATAVAERSTFAEPYQLATGVEHVLVNGKPAVTDGRVTAARHGQVLRR
ncbi:MAG: D-aminoacylase [Propionibacteriales bacterium]|nr:D-aminoacylase [Propionibacteriales bacterium]